MSSEILELERKEAIHRLSPINMHGHGVLQQHLCSPQEGRRLEICHQLKKLSMFIHVPHFKMENINHLKDLLIPGYFLDLKSAYLTCSTNEQTILEVSPFPVGGISLRVQNSPFWFSNSTNNIYKAAPASISISAFSRDTPPHLSRRYTSSCPNISLRYSPDVSHNKPLGIFLNQKCILNPSQNVDYRMLQMLHSRALSRYQQNYDSYIPWTQEACQDLEWWIDQMPTYNSHQILPRQAEVCLE